MNSLQWFKNCLLLYLIQDQNSKFKMAEILRKKSDLKFPGNMHIYKLCPNYLQSFTKFQAAV